MFWFPALMTALGLGGLTYLGSRGGREGYGQLPTGGSTSIMEDAPGDWWDQNYEEILNSLLGRATEPMGQSAIQFAQMLANPQNIREITNPERYRRTGGWNFDPNVALSALGSSTSLIGTGYSGLQGFRQQDLRRYLGEMGLQAQMQMANQGGGFLSDLLGLGSMALPFIPGVGPYGQAGSMLWNLLSGGGGGSPGGGIQYSPNWGFGRGGGW